MDIKTSIIESNDILTDKPLFIEFNELLEPLWQNSNNFFEKELSKVEKIFVGRNLEGKLLGFSSWGLHPINFEGQKKYTAFLGLGTISKEVLGRGVGKTIIYGGVDAAFDDLHNKFGEQAANFAWCVTVSPVGYLGLKKRYPINFSPSLEGRDEHNNLALLAIHKYLNTNFDRESPYILRNFSTGRYTTEERQRLKEVSKTYDIPIFSSNKLDERNGDRIIIMLSRQ